MKVALIDSALLAHRAKYAFRKTALSTPGIDNDVIRSEVLYGFMTQTIAVARAITPDLFVFAWDSRQSYRRDSYPEYKENRKRDKTLEETEYDNIAFEQFSRIRRSLIPMLGFNNTISVEGLEADDIIASIIATNHEHKYTIVSTDNDLLQLLKSNVVMYSPFTKEVTDDKDFIKKWGVLPPKWGLAKAYAGCTTDNVQGIKGVGMKTAIRYISNKNVRKDRLQAILNNPEIVERNKELVLLPHRMTPPIKLKEDKLEEMSFIRVFSHYGFDSLLGDMDEWKTLFNLN